MKNQKNFVVALIIVLLIIVVVYFTKNNKSDLFTNGGIKDGNSLVKQEDEEGKNTSKKSDDLKLTKLFDNKIEIFLPEGFTLMDETMAQFKYPSNNRPEIIYTNSAGNINIALNRTNTPATESDLPLFSEQFGQMFQNVKDFQSNEIITQNGKKFIIIKMITGAVDTDVYNLMAIGTLDGKLFMVTFNCTVEEMSVWKPIGGKVIESIKIN